MKKVASLCLSKVVIKKAFVFFLCTMFLFQYSMLPVMASNISGVTGNNGVYNIDPSKSNSSGTGFRHYSQFDLSKGDIANLIFKHGGKDIERFVNLVDGRVNINGILNTMRDNNFYNGHAIFVSPQGMVVGASGVLNVGALTVKVPTQAGYLGLLGGYGAGSEPLESVVGVDAIRNLPSTSVISIVTGNLGEQFADDILGIEGAASIEINGKIYARDGVDLHAKNIKITGTDENGNPIKDIDGNVAKPAIFSGLNNTTYNQQITTHDAAEALFTTLVNTKGLNKETGTTFKNVDGKIVIKAEDIVTIRNTSIEETEASVTVRDAYLDGVGIDISAEAKTNYGTGSLPNLVPPIIQKALDAVDTIEDIAAGRLPTEGASAKAIVNIIDSELISQNDVNISSKADASTKYSISTVDWTTASAYFLKNSASSEVNIGTTNNTKKTNISAGNDVNINAVSKSELDASITDSSFLTMADNPVKIGLIHSSSDSSAKVTVDKNSTVKAKNLDVNAVNAVNHHINAAYSTGVIPAVNAPGAGILVAINKNNAVTQAIFNGTFETTDRTGADSGVMNVNSQTLYISDTNLNASGEASPNGLQGALATRITGLVGGKLPSLDIGGIMPAVGGAVLVNDSKLTTEATVGNTAKVTAKKLDINANLIDLTSNQAIAKGEAPQDSSSTTVSAGAAIIINNQNNTTIAQIADGVSGVGNHAVIDANDITINATSEFPMNMETLEMIVGAYDAAGRLINSAGQLVDSLGNLVDAAGNLLNPGDDPVYGEGKSFSDLMSNEFFNDYLSGSISDTIGQITDIKLIFTKRGALGAAGFVNNYAQSTGKGGDASIAGSVIYSDIKNTTTAKVGNYSDITTVNSLSLNAANDVISTNFAGNIGAIAMIPTPGGAGGDDTSGAVGGAVIVASNEHNANAQIGNNVIVKGGNTANVSLNSANDQLHINIAAGGGKAQKAAVMGSVAVVDIAGTTTASIGNSSEIEANSVTLNAGTAKIKKAKRDSMGQGYGFTSIGSDNKITLKDAESDITDKTMTVTVTGALSQKEGNNSGAAIGASVGVVSVEKQIIASVGDGTNITVDTFNADAKTATQNINVAIAGAFAGGVAAKTGPSTGDKVQQMFNFGDWMGKKDTVLAMISGSTDPSKPNATDKANSAQNSATGSDVTNEMKNSNVKNSMDNAGKDHSDTSGTGTKKDTLGDSLTGNDQLSNVSGLSDVKNTLDVAAAGSVNVNLIENTVTASVGENVTIKAKSDVSLNASQTTDNISISGGVAGSKNIGAGAALNLSMNDNATSAYIGKGSKIGTENNNTYKPNVSIKAADKQRAINVAVGVGAVKEGSGPPSDGASVAVGGSFNVNVMNNAVAAYIDENVKIYNSQKVDVIASNVSEIYQGAGGVGANFGSGSGSNIGAGVAANVNIFGKETTAKINKGSVINSDGKVSVLANGSNTNTEKLVSVSVGGAVVNPSGNGTALGIAGSINVDVFDNATKAQIIGANIEKSSAVSVVANDMINNLGIAGALVVAISSSSAYGVGVGSVVNVIMNENEASIVDSTVNSSGAVEVKAKQSEDLDFVAVNGGLAKGDGSASFTLNVNGIVNVANSKVNAFVAKAETAGTGSQINADSLTVSSEYINDIWGNTDAVGVAINGGAAAGNIIANVFKNKINAYISDSNTDINKALLVSASATENIDVIPVGIAISVDGPAAVAANISANVLVNETNAYIAGNKPSTSGKIEAGSVKVSASDDTTVKRRGGTLAVNTSDVAVGGSIAVDVLHKIVNASIGKNTVVDTDGKTTVSASSTNSFGPSSSNLELSGTTPSFSVDGADFPEWEMTYDLSGGNKAAVSGSLLTKVVNNQVSAIIYEGAKINASAVDVLASNSMTVRAIVGTIAASGKVAVGLTSYVNVAIGEIVAGINSGAEITTTSGSVLVSADSLHDYQTIMVVGGASGKVAVGGSVNVNTIVDNTEAYIDKNVKVDSAGALTVIADEQIDVNSLNVSASVSGNASVGAMAYVNVFDNTVTSRIGAAGADNAADKTIKAEDDIIVKAKSSESFSALMANVGVSGNVAVNGTAIINVISANVNSYIQRVNAASNSGSINVLAQHDFNQANDGLDSAIGTGFFNYLKGKENSKINLSDFNDSSTAGVPFVMVAGLSASGSVAVNGSVVVNTLESAVNAQVLNSTISTASSLNINALSRATTYDLVVGLAASAYASIALTGTNTIITSETNALLVDSVINKGNVNVKAKDDINLNSIAFTVTGAAEGAAVAATENVNKVQNVVSATVDNVTTTDSNSTIAVAADNKVTANTAIAIGSGVGVGAAVNAGVIVNIIEGMTMASIVNSDNIKAKNVSVKTSDNVDIYGVFAGASMAGVGVNAGVYSATAVIDREQKASIEDSTLNVSEAILVEASSDLDIYNLVFAVGISGIGAKLAGSAITNVVDNTVSAYLYNTKTLGDGTLTVQAKQDTYVKAGIASVGLAGVGVSGSLHAITNIMEDDVVASIGGDSTDDSVLNNSSNIVNAEAKHNLNVISASGDGGGIGAVAGSSIVNVLDNKVTSHISKTKINGGTTNVSSKQTVNIDAKSASVAASGFVSIGARAIVNILTNKNSAYIEDSIANNITSITTDAQTIQTFNNDLVSVTVAPMGGAVGLGVLVNSIENETNSYINNLQTTGTRGAYTVTAKDKITLSNLSGVASAGYGAGAGAANVNIINNSVVAEIKGTQKINATTVNVNSESDITNNTTTASAAAGLAGIAGSVAITSIGDKFNLADANNENTSGEVKNYITSSNKGVADENTRIANHNAGLNPGQEQANSVSSTNTLDQTDSSLANIKTNTTYQHTNSKGEQVTYSAPDLTVKASTNGDTANQGTVARISAPVDATGDVNVSALNQYGGTIKNASAAGGAVAIGASVLVTTMKYKTTAEIDGGNIKSNGNISLIADTIINSKTDATSIGAGALVINGNVGVFKNTAVTSALIKNSPLVEAANIYLKAHTDSTISAKALSGSVGVGSANIVVALADDIGVTEAGIKNSTSVKADSDIDVVASNKAALSSEMQAGAVSGIAISALVNRAHSRSKTKAEVSSSSVEADNNINITSGTDGVTTAVTARAGSVALIGVTAIDQEARSNAGYETNIGAGANIKAKNVNLKSGVQTSRTKKANGSTDKVTVTDTGGLVSAITDITAASAGLINAEHSKSVARVEASSLIDAAAGSVIESTGTGDTDGVTALAAMGRNATAGGSSSTFSGITVKNTGMYSHTGGSSTIDLKGQVNSAKNVKLHTKDVSNSKVESISKSVGLIGVDIYNSSAGSNTNAIINTGSISAPNIDIDANIDRTVTSFSASKALSFISGASANSITDLRGKAEIYINGTVSNNKTINADTLTKNYVNSYIIQESTALVALQNGKIDNYVGTENHIMLSGNITSSGDINLKNNTANTLKQRGDSDSVAVIAVKGGTLNNTINNWNTVNFGNGSSTAEIVADNINLTSGNKLESIGTVEYNDSAKGFINKSGAIVNTHFTASNAVNVNNKATVKPAKKLNISLANSSNYKQKVTSKHSSFSSYNKATSNVSVNDYNYFNSNAGSKIVADTTNVKFDSNHNISSKSDVETHHFAGQPSTYSSADINVKNYANIAGSIYNESDAYISFMKNSNNYITQDAWIYAEASVASGDHAGRASYNVYNEMDVKAGGEMKSGNGIYVDFTMGRADITSRVAYEKVSRLLFGIPIRSKGSSNRSSTSHTAKMTNNGLMQAGKGTQKITINADGTITTENADNLNYTITDSGTVDGEKLTEDLVARLKAEYDILVAELDELKNLKDSNDAEIAKYEASLTEITALLNYIDANQTGALTDAGLSNSINSGAYSYVSGSGASAEITAALIEDITNKAMKYIDDQYKLLGDTDFAGKDYYFNEATMNNAIAHVLDTYGSNVPTTDGDGNPTTRSLAAGEIDTLKEAFGEQTKLFGTTKPDGASSYELITFDGKLVNGTIRVQDSSNPDNIVSTNLLTYLTDTLNAQKTETTDSISAITNMLNSLNERISSGDIRSGDITDQFNYYIGDATAQDAYFNGTGSLQNVIADYTISNPTIKFDDIGAGKSEIAISGLPMAWGTNENGAPEYKPVVHGNGEFRILAAGLEVNNYSDYNLVFGNVGLGSANGLYLNGRNYNRLASQFDPNDSSVFVKRVQAGSTGSTFLRLDGEGNAKIITHYDHNDVDPDFLALYPNPLPADITITGAISAPAGGVDVYNESGDIFIGGNVDGQTLSIIASQGNVTLQDAVNLTVKEADRIIAGKDILINANKLVLDGLIKAGINDRSLVITDDMLLTDNLVVDPVTGKKNLINVKSRTYQSTEDVNNDGIVDENDTYTVDERSAYLFDDQNIKAVYDAVKDEILLFNTDASSGSVTINAKTSSGTGNIIANVGAGTVNIDNQTDSMLVVNRIVNNEEGGGISASLGGSIAKTVNFKTRSKTDIASVGEVVVQGVISNGLYTKGTNTGFKNAAGHLNIASETGVSVLEHKDINLLTVDTIVAQGPVNITNTGDKGITVAGRIETKNSKVTVANTNENNSGITVTSTGRINAENGDIDVDNHGKKGITIAGRLFNKKGNITIDNNKTAADAVQASGITVANGGSVAAYNGDIDIVNTGSVGTTIAGVVSVDNKGKINIDNKNTDASKLQVASTGKVQNENGNILISNVGTGHTIIEGLIKTLSNDNDILINDYGIGSNIIIGDANNNAPYIHADKANVIINQVDGDILNAGYDKTLIYTGKNLDINVEDGSVGAYNLGNQTYEAGHSIFGSTRDFKEIINVTAKGTVNIEALNSAANQGTVRLINVASKNADLKVDRIVADGNVMLTAADWKQADDPKANTNIPYPNEAYFHGYSILNAADPASTEANVEGYNISIITSNDLGSSSKQFTVNSRTDLPGHESSTISIEAENDIYFGTKGNSAVNLWQMISKRGNIDLTLDGAAVIREITSGKHLHILQKDQSLTIYDLGKATSFDGLSDDLLYPHDLISIGGSSGWIVPDTIAIEVLDVIRKPGDDAKSVLNIYNAWAKGHNGGKGATEVVDGYTRPKSDIVLRADKIIANAYGSPNSSVSTVDRPNGLNASENRTYNSDNPFDDTLAHNAQASGFNTYGKGKPLVFDIRGVDPEFVKNNYEGSYTDRAYYEQPLKGTIDRFSNPYAMDPKNPKGNYKVDEVLLSINSNDQTLENRGASFNYLYTDNAYIDTRDLNLSFRDTLINQYGELRNGNRGGEGGYKGNYRWVTVVDNDFRRLVNLGKNHPREVTLQLFSQKTGSFALDMGNLIVLKTMGPAVNYNPHEVTNYPRTENSFYRLTYKDDKIQEKTTTSEFDDISKDTHSPTTRLAIRFLQQEGAVGIEHPAIKEVTNLSRTGVGVIHDGTLKKGQKVRVKIEYESVSTEVDAEVVRVAADNINAGLKFINMDKATANKILYINMLLANEGVHNAKAGL